MKKHQLSIKGHRFLQHKSTANIRSKNSSIGTYRHHLVLELFFTIKILVKYKNHSVLWWGCNTDRPCRRKLFKELCLVSRSLLILRIQSRSVVKTLKVHWGIEVIEMNSISFKSNIYTTYQRKCKKHLLWT